jgi:transcriptional regulator with XRE-family HTH domain
MLAHSGKFAIYGEMKIAAAVPETTVLEELGRRAQQQRVGMNLTQPQLAEVAGISSRTIERFEAGASIQLDKLVRILRALRLSANLDQLVPEASVRPLQLAGSKSSIRHRAYTRKNTLPLEEEGWKWGDEK